MSWLGAPVESLRLWWAVRGLRAFDQRQARDHVWDFKNLILEAKDNFEQGNRKRALDVWHTAQATFPDLAMTSEAALDLLMNMQRYDEAEALLSAGVKKHPKLAQCLEGLALVAYKRGDRDEALRRCDTLRKIHPGSQRGYGIAAAVMSEMGRADEAEAILSRGLRVMPNDVGLRIEYAKAPERRGDWQEALRRWTEVRDIYGHIAGTLGIATSLKELGRYDEADQVLADIFYKAGNEFAVWVGFASIAEHKKDWEEAARRWENVRKRFPLVSVGYLHGVGPLLTLGRHDEADAVVREGLDRIPDDPAIQVEHAWLAHRRGDWLEAVQRWTTVRERFPDRREGFARGADALNALGRTDEAAALRANVTD